MRRVAITFAVAWAAGVGAWFALGPVYRSQQTETSAIAPPGAPAPPRLPAHETTASGLAINGPRVLLVLAVPLLLALAPLVAPRRRVPAVAGVSAALLLVFALVGGFSVGLFYLPAVVALGLAARSPSRS